MWQVLRLVTSVAERRLFCYLAAAISAGRGACLLVSLSWAATSATASIPSPREEGDLKSGKLTSADSLTPEQRDVHLPKGKTFPDHLKFGTYWQEPVLCGPNALFVLAQLVDLDVTREEVTELVPVSASGSTLADLSRAATRIGLPHEIRKVSQSELFRLNPPFIVHEEVRSTDQEARDTGHFFVVIRFKDNGQVGIVDGVSGLYQLVEMARFDRSFSGYVLLPELDFFGIPLRYAWSALYGIAIVLTILSGVLIYLRWPVKIQAGLATS